MRFYRVFQVGNCRSKYRRVMFREPVVKEMLKSPQDLARRWAARMSTPEYTHSADGSERLADDWTVEDAKSILEPLSELAKKTVAGHQMYLLLEW